jgi:hypothetical protein
MVNVTTLDGTEAGLKKLLGRCFQSGNINLLLGSGASVPAVPTAGPIEQEIATLITAGQDDQAKERLYVFLAQIQNSANQLISGNLDADNENTLAQYIEFLGLLEKILSERRTTLLRKQATVFTTNYDLFVERASIGYPSLQLNDGFTRVPSLDNRMEFSSRNFFNTTYNVGTLYSYRVELPAINLVKLHGSLSWHRDKAEIVYRTNSKASLTPPLTPEAITHYIEAFSVVLPEAAKFRMTLLDRTYYELLRIYSNELDRENSLLLAFGFSFADEHIAEITKRALKNPTLRLFIFAFDQLATNAYAASFNGYSNVDIVRAPPGETIDFARFNKLLRETLPAAFT